MEGVHTSLSFVSSFDASSTMTASKIKAKAIVDQYHIVLLPPLLSETLVISNKSSFLLQIMSHSSSNKRQRSAITVKLMVERRKRKSGARPAHENDASHQINEPPLKKQSQEGSLRKNEGEIKFSDLAKDKKVPDNDSSRKPCVEASLPQKDENNNNNNS